MGLDKFGPLGTVIPYVLCVFCCLYYAHMRYVMECDALEGIIVVLYISKRQDYRSISKGSNYPRVVCNRHN